jgi:hypothetical protein
VEDCADACAAVGLIGDGVCDDGTAGKGNFNCAVRPGDGGAARTHAARGGRPPGPRRRRRRAS